MKVLMRCDGCFDFDSVLVSEQERTIVNKLLEKGLIENCEQGDFGWLKEHWPTAHDRNIPE